MLLNTNKDLLEREFKKTPFIIVPKKVRKYLEINLTKEAKDL